MSEPGAVATGSYIQGWAPCSARYHERFCNARPPSRSGYCPARCRSRPVKPVNNSTTVLFSRKESGEMNTQPEPSPVDAEQQLIRGVGLWGATTLNMIDMI